MTNQAPSTKASERDIGHSAQEAIPDPAVYMDTALGIATIIAEANERLYRVQSEAATIAFADISKQLNALLTTANPADALVQWADRYQVNVRRPPGGHAHLLRDRAANAGPGGQIAGRTFRLLQQ